MEFVNAYKSSSIIYDLDTSGGLMEEVQRLIAPPLSDINRREKKNCVNNFGYKKPKANNHEYCDSCFEGGDLLCCDKCPVSFHLQCYDPPFSEETAPKGFWICRRCKTQMDIFKNASSTCSVAYNKHMQFFPKVQKSQLVDNQNNLQHFQTSCDGIYTQNATLKFPVFQEIQLYDLKNNNNGISASKPTTMKQNNDIYKYINKLSDQNVAQSDTLKRKRNVSYLRQRWSQFMCEPISRLCHNSYLYNPTEFKLPKNMNSQYNFPGSTKSKNTTISLSNSIPVTSSANPLTNLQNHQTRLQPPENEILKTLNPSQSNLPGSNNNVNSAKKDLITDNYLWTSPLIGPTVKNKILNLPHELDNHNLVPLPPKVCFVCNRSCQKQILLQCDYCPLLYHLDCLDPPLTFPPNTQWMCPSHPEHLLEERLWKSNSLAERIKVWEILPPDDNSNANPSSFTVKAKFLHKVHRKHPPFRYKIKHPGRTRIRVPDDVRKAYQTYRCNDDGKHYKTPSQFNCNSLHNDMANYFKTFPTQSNSDAKIAFTPATKHHIEPCGKALPHEQEEFISSLMTLQARTATHSHDTKVATNHGWLGKELQRNHPKHTIPESPNLISRLIHRLQDHLSPPSLNHHHQTAQPSNNWSDSTIRADTNFPFAITSYDSVRNFETSNSKCYNSSSISSSSVSTTTTSSSLATLKFSLSNLKLKNLSIAPKNNLPPMPTSLFIRQLTPPSHKSVGHNHQGNGLKRGSSVDTPLVVSANSCCYVNPDFKSAPSLTDSILLTPVMGVDLDGPTLKYNFTTDKNQVIKVLKLNNTVQNVPPSIENASFANGSLDEESSPTAVCNDVKSPSRCLDFVNSPHATAENEFCDESGPSLKSDSPIFNGTGDPISQQLAELLERREAILAKTKQVNGEKLFEEVHVNPTLQPVATRNKLCLDKTSSFTPTLNGYSLPNGICEENCKQNHLNNIDEPHEKNLNQDLTPAKAFLYPRHTFQKPYDVMTDYVTIGAGLHNELNLENFGLCKFVSSRHACLFYDEETGDWDVINQSFYGTTIIRQASTKLRPIANGTHEISCSYEVPECMCCISPPATDNADEKAIERRMLIFNSTKLKPNDILKFGCIQFTFTPSPDPNDNGDHS